MQGEKALSKRDTSKGFVSSVVSLLVRDIRYGNLVERQCGRKASSWQLSVGGHCSTQPETH